MRRFTQAEQKNIAIFERFIHEVWNERRPETIYELLAPDYVCHFEHKDIKGPDGMKKESYDPIVRAFPDVQVEIQDITANGDFVIRGHEERRGNLMHLGLSSESNERA